MEPEIIDLGSLDIGNGAIHHGGLFYFGRAICDANGRTCADGFVLCQAIPHPPCGMGCSDGLCCDFLSGSAGLGRLG